MLVDEVQLHLIGGHGGAGKVSFVPRFKGGPDGGNGGKGGDLYIKATSDLTALNRYSAQKEFQAENGGAGGSNRKFGKDGEDLTLLVPVGAALVDEQTKEEIEFIKPDEVRLICKGGLGGRGNYEFRSSRRTTPEYAQPGLPGEDRHFQIVLKLIADFGLVGVPNAGKSSLLNELTSANAKVGDYPFTTLEPNLGVINGKIVADIPGLIEGASGGKGLGIKFLKHIEKVRVLLHCISSESENVLEDYKVVRQELEKYSQDLLDKKEIILLTKADTVSKDELEERLKELKKLKKEVIAVSIHDLESLESLEKLLKI